MHPLDLSLASSRKSQLDPRDLSVVSDRKPQSEPLDLSLATARKPQPCGAEFLPDKQQSDWCVDAAIRVQTGGSHDVYHGLVDRSRGKMQYGDHAHVGDISK